MKENEFVDLFNLADSDVLSFESGEHIFKVDKFKKAVDHAFEYSLSEAFIKSLDEKGIKGISISIYSNVHRGYVYKNKLWFSTGKECEVLKPGSTGWQKGKVRLKVVLEFCPDEVEDKVEENSTNESLDGLRKQLNMDS